MNENKDKQKKDKLPEMLGISQYIMYAYTNELVAECEKKVERKISAVNVYEIREDYIVNKGSDPAILDRIPCIVSLNIVGREECEE